MAASAAGGGSAMTSARETAKTVIRQATLRLYANPIRRAYESGRISAQSLRLPDFLGIGAPKAGTTWLHHNLAAHPDLFLPEGKEMHYFSDHQFRGLLWYARQFEDAGPRRCGEITPGYAVLPRRDIERIARLIPRVRLLLLVRDPVDRAWSHAVMKLSRETGRSIDSISDEEFAAHFAGEHSTERGDYLRMIDNWTSVFSEDQLWIGSFDDLRDHPTELLVSVFDHLGVKRDVDWSRFPHQQVIDRGVHGTTDVFGKSKGPDMPERLAACLRRELAPQIAAFADRYPSIGDPWRAA
jgi:hypothetical protein